MTQPFPQLEETLENISEEGLKELWERLLLYAHKHYGWLQDKIRGGFDLRVLVAEAIEDAYLGERHQPPGLPIFPFLCGVIKSKASHLWQQERRAVFVEYLDAPSSREFTSARLRHEECYQQILYEELANKIRELVHGDELLVRIVEKWLAEPGLRPREVADELQIDGDEMRKAQKRLRRRLESLKKEWIDDEE